MELKELAAYFFNFIQNKNKKLGLIIIEVIVIYVWLWFEENITGTKTYFLKSSPFIPTDKIFLVILMLLILLIWAILTNRISLPSSKKDIVYVCVNYDDEEYASIISKLFNKVITELNVTHNFAHIKFVLKPDGYFKNLEEASQWLTVNGNLVQSIILIELTTGNTNNSKKVSVNKIGLSLPDDFLEVNLGLSKLRLEKELLFVFRLLDFDYIESNSFEDKQKFQNSFREFIKFYASFILAVNNRYESSINLMRELYKPSDRIIAPSKSFKERMEFVVNPKSIRAARYSDLLFHVTIKGAHQLVIKREYQQAYKLLTSLSEFDIPANFMGNYSIELAFCAYKSGDLTFAINANTKLLKLGSKFKGVYTVNKLFLSIIQDDMKGYCDAFCDIKPSTDATNPIQLIEFYEDERDNISEHSDCIELSQALLYICFVYQTFEEKKVRLEQLQTLIKNKETFSVCIKHLDNIVNEERRKHERLERKIKKNYNSSRAA